MPRFFQALLLFCALTLPALASGADAPVFIRWELASLPDNGRVAVLWLTPGEGYKFYAHDPGQTGMPTQAQVRLLPQGTALPVLYPSGKAAKDQYETDKTVNIHDGPTPLFIPLPDGAPEDFGLDARVTLLACTQTSCWPVSLESGFSSREVPAPSPAKDQPWWNTFAGLAGTSGEPAAEAAVAKAVSGPPGSPGQGGPGGAWSFTPRPVSPALEVDGLLKALPLAFLAGILLNLMPCVLPVACLKLSGLLAACHAHACQDRNSLIREHNVFFAMGVLGYFCLLAVLLGMAEMAWGELFQQPGLILGASVVLFALGLSLFGVFHLPVIDLKFASRQDKSPRSQALATGFLATLLATPCSGPLLGGVLAWTLMQPVAVVVAVFVGIGLGMAAPYLLLAARPELTRFVPRPGDWMVQLEKIAGFLVMGTCLYFLSILPGPLLLPALATLLVTALACHAWGSWTSLSQGVFTRWGIRLIGAGLAVAACFWALTPPTPEDAVWQPFDRQAFERDLGEKAMLLDFTADWCPTCKALEKTVLTPSATRELIKRFGVKTVRVDLTRQDPEAMALLRALGSASIPLAAVFPKGKDASRPVVIRDLFTSSQLEAALKEALGNAK